jgi:hypothetical protein
MGEELKKKETRVVGLDIGTGLISSTEKSEEPKKLKLRKVRDAFLKINPEEFMDGNAPQFGEKMLKKTGTHFIKLDGILYILGDSAYEMALESNKTLLRPMSKGVLNPNEPVAALMVEELIKAVIGTPVNDDDVVFFSIPADPIDADYDVIYHRDTVTESIRNIGYKNVHHLREGLSVIFSELYDDNFTGLGISMGAGMANVSYAYKGMEILCYAVSKSGDWIDQSAAKQVNDSVAVLTYRKEAGMDIRDPKDEYEKAIATYYKSLIEYLIKSFTHLYKKKDKRELPRLFKPIPLVISGGTSLVGGFIATFEEYLKKEKDFPIQISDVRHANNPIYTVAHGLFQAAKLNTELGDE